MSHRYLLILLGLVLIGIGLFERGWLLLAIWFGSNFLTLGIAHALGCHRVFGKRSDGTLPLWSWFVFLPLLLFTYLVWHILRLCSSEPAHNKVMDGLVVGRRLRPDEVEGEFVNYVDLTAEFPEPRAIRRHPSYQCFPILDGAAPDPTELGEAINRCREGRTFIHCAQGHGRTGLFALAMMLKTGAVQTVAEGLEKLRAVRPAVNLSDAQRRCIEDFAARLR